MSNLVPNSVRIFILLAATALLATSSEAAVLYDQTAGASAAGESSQEFGPANALFSNQGADDFTVPAGGWTIRSVDVLGVIGNDPAPLGFEVITNVDVIFYNNSGGLPGSVVASFTDLLPVLQDTAGDFTVNLPCELQLAPGTYWMSVYVDEDFATFGQWYWETNNVANGNFAVWQNPGAGFGVGCTSWSVRTSCLSSVLPDNSFALHDSLQGCISTFPYSQDWEACATGAGWMSGGTSSTWALATPSGTVLNSAATPGVNSWWTSGGTPIPGGEMSYVESPCFDFSGLLNPEIVLDINDDANNAALNGAILQASTDGGMTWINVGSNTSSTVTTLGPSTNWYNAAGLAGTGAGGQNASHWSGLGGGWQTAYHLLTNAAGTVSLGGQSDVRLRIAFASNLGIAGEGFAFDNIIIREGPVVDLRANAVLSPNTACGLTNAEIVGVEIENLGTVAQTGFDVTYQIVGPNGDTITENVGAFSIGAGAIDTFNFATPFDASAAGGYDITVFVVTSGDADNSNDTATASFSSLLVPADPTALQNDTICGLDTLCLTASGTNLTWWDAQMGGNELLRGDTLCIINPPATDTYWVSNNTLTEDSLFVSTAAGNGADGNFFEVTVNNGIILTGIYGHNSNTLAVTWEVWYRPGGLTTANMASSAGWTQISNPTVVGGGLGNLSVIDLGLSVNLPAGTYSFHVVADQGGTQYTNGTVLGGVWASDAELTVFEGYGTTGVFSGGNFQPRNWNGALTYEIPGCESNRLAVYGVVESADPVTIANDTSFCGTPGPVTMTANSTGSYTYTWTGTANSGLVGNFVGNPLVTTPSFGASQVFVEGVDGNGCVARDTADIFIANVSVDTIIGTDSICPGDSATLSVSVSGNGIPVGVVLSEDFETFPGGQNTNISLNGWTESGSGYWSGDEGGTSSTNTGPDVDHTTGTASGRYIYLETSGGANTTNYFISPIFDISGLNGSTLSFWYHMFGAAMGTLEVEVSTNGGATWTTAFSISGQQQGSGLAPWTNVVVPLAPDVNQIRFVGLGGTSFTSDMAIDDVEISGSPISVAWSPGATLTSTSTTNTIAFPSTITTYQVIAIDSASGCTDSGSFTVNLRVPPAAPVAADSSRCGDGSVLMTAVGAGGLLQWFYAAGNPFGAGSPVASPVVNSDTSFFVNETDVFGCVSEFDTANITVFGADSLQITASDTVICDSGTVTLTATQLGSLAYSYIFNWGQTAGGGLNTTLGAIVTANPTQSATYTVTGQDLGGSGCQVIATIDVAFGNTPVAPVSVSNDSVCAGDSIQLEANGDVQVFFEDFETSIIGDPGTLPAGWNRNTLVDPNWNPEDATGFNENSSGTGPVYDHTFFGTPGGVYIFMETSGGTNGDTGDIQSPVIDLTNYGTASANFWYFMHGANIDRMGMDVSTDGGATWTNLWLVVGQQQANQTTDPWLQANVSLNAYVGQTINLRWWGLNVACCSGDIALDDVEVQATPAYNFSWSPSAGLSNPNGPITSANPTVNTDYIVTVTDAGSGCANMDTISVVAFPLPGAPTALDTSRCGTGTVPLIASATGTADSLRWFDLAGNYLGNGGSITSPIIASTTQFRVAEFNNGCEGPSDTMTATVITADSLSLSVTDTTVCGPNVPVSITATQQGSLSYFYLLSWSIDSGSVSPAIGAVTTTASATSTATVTVTGSDAGSGCAAVATATINVVDLPVVTASVDIDSVCSGDTVNLSATVSPTPFNYSLELIPFDTFANAGTPISLGFNVSAIVPIPFGFEFYGNTYNFGYVTANGLFGFDVTGVTSNASVAIPAATTPNNFIAGLWEYLRPDNSVSTPSVRYQTVGVAPNRVFVITYSQVPFGFNTGTNTFQIQLYEGSNVIEVHTTEVNDAGSFQSSTVGIENATGTLGVAVPGRNDQDFNVTVPDAYRFSPPTSYSYAWMPMAGVLNPDTLATAAVVSSSTSYVFSAFDSTTGCAGYDTVDVYTNPVLPAPISAGFDVCGAQSVNLSAVPGIGSPQNSLDSIFYFILPANTLIGSGLFATSPVILDTTSFRIVERINGCEGNDLIITINVQTADSIVITPSDTFICDTAATVTLTASSAAPYAYTWTGPDILSGQGTNTIVVGPNSTASYQVTGLNPNPPNCQNVAFANVAVGSNPVTNALPTLDSICEGASVNIQAFNPPNTFSETFSSFSGPSANAAQGGWTESGFGRWQTENNQPSSGTTTGPSVDHTSQVSASPSMYVYLETSGGGVGNFSYLTSPLFDVSALTNTNLSFWYYMHGATMGTLSVEVSSNGGATWTQVFTQTGAVQASAFEPWINVTVPVPNTTNRIRLVGLSGSSFTSDMAIDDVEVTGILPYTVSWSPAAGLLDPNANATTASPTVSTTYIATVTDTGSGCFALDTVDIFVTPTPAKPTAYDSTRCGVGTVELTALAGNNNDSLRWFDMAGNFLGSGTPLTSPILTDTTDFRVVEYTNGCEGVRDTMTANVIPTDTIVVTASDTAVCGSGTTVSFTATQVGGGAYTYTYTWTGNQMIDSLGPNASAVVNVTGTYTVIGTDTSLGTGCANTNSVTVVQNPLPVTTLPATDTICEGDTVELVAGGSSTVAFTEDFESFFVSGSAAQNGWSEGGSFNWQADNNGTGSGGTGPAVDHTTGLSTGMYIYTEASGTSGTTNLFTSPVFSTAGLANITVSFWYHMYGGNMGTLSVEASTDGGATWTQIFSISGPQQFSNFAPWLQATALAPSGTNRIRFVGLIGPGFTSDMAIDDVEITGLQPFPTVWTPSTNLSNPSSSITNAYPTTSTQYIAAVTDPVTGCTAFDTIDIEVVPTPAKPVAVDTGRCGIGTVDLIATAGGNNDSLYWFDLAGNLLGTGSPLTSPFLTANDQFVVYESDRGCAGPTDTADVVITPAATIIIAASDTAVCGSGTTVSFTATQVGGGAYTYMYNWSSSVDGGLNSTMGASVTATPIATGNQTYIVVGTDAGTGCANSDTVVVTVEPIPTVTATATPDSVCSGDPVNLNGIVNPAPGAYVVSSTSFDTIPGTGTNVSLGDNAFTTVPLGFTFTFFGNNYTTVSIGSNGFLSFGGGSTSSNSLAVPNAAFPSNLIAFAWEDLNPSAGGSIDYFTTGVAPDRVFVMNFRNVPFYLNTGSVSVQVQLHESTGNIEIHNVAVNTAGSFQSIVQGIENSTGTVGAAVPGRNDADWDAFLDAWVFAPAGPQTYLWTGQAIANATQLSTTANPTTSGNYILTVTTSAGCTASDTVPVNILPLPFNLTPNNMQTTATDFRWNSGNPGSNYTVYWGPVGFIPGGAGQLGQTSGTSAGGINTTGTATVNATQTQSNNNVGPSTVTNVFNVPAGGNITNAILNLRIAGDFDGGGTFESANASINGTPVGTLLSTVAQCGPLESVGSANINVTALLQGNPTVNLEFFITNGVTSGLCGGGNIMEWSFTIDTVVAGPTTATGLLPNTTYQFYVEEDCGITGPINFTTPVGCFWLGNNSNWADPNNWSAACGGVPRGCGAPDVTVGPTSNDPIVSVDDSLNNISIIAGASVTIDPTINLFVCGDWDNAGTFSHGDGRVVMYGDSSQQIIGTSTFGFLEIDNQSGNDVSLAPGAQVSITDGLVMTNANLNIPGSAMVTIISDAGGTGYVDDFTSGTAGSIVGNITMQRLVRNTGAGSAFYYISSAVGGIDVSDWSDDFSTEGQLYGIPVGNSLNGRQVIPVAACLVDSLDPYSPYGGLFNYIETAVTGCTLEGWHVKSGGAINAGEGYAGIIPDGVVVDVTGPANTGTITFPVTRSGGNTSTPGFNLSGNPYPSAIDWATVVADNAGIINGTAYMWQSTGFYAGVTLPLNVMISGEIGSSQGFEVEALVNGNLTFNQGQRTTGDPAFFRSAPLWDQRLDLIVEGNNFADITNIVFSGVSTDGFDGWYDSYKGEVNSFQPSIWTKLNGDDMSINSFADFDGSEVVDLSMAPGQTGTYTIRAEYLETFDATTLVFLEDKQEGVIHCLNFAPSYTFNSDENDAPDRFLVYFTPPAQISTVDASCSGNDGSVTIDLGVFSHAGATFQWDTYQVLDGNNNVISTGSNANGVINVSNVTAGTYTLVLGYQGNTITEQIVVDGDQAVLAAFNVVGTQHFAGDPIDFTNTTTGANDHTWDFGDGTVLTGVVNPTYAYAQPGTYLVKLISTNDDGCQDISTTTVEVSDKTTGIGGVEDDFLRVYGADNTIFVDVIDVTEPVTDVKVFDMNGKLILSTEVEGKNLHSIPMEEAAGYYIVRAENGDLTISRKVLIVE